MRENIVFEKKQNVIPITLEELKVSLKQTEANGALPKSRPVEHFQFIEDVMEIAAKNGLTPQLEDIWVSQSDSKRVPVLDPDKVGLLKSWLFQRLVCRINLPSTIDEQYNQSFGIGYNTKGMTLVVGTNVMVCQNMSIFGDQMIQTFGNNRIVDYTKIKSLTNDWFAKCMDKHATDVNILEEMKNVELSSEGLKTIIGDLQTMAVKDAYYPKDSEDSPLNIGQVSMLSKDIIKEYGTIPDALTLDSAYNICTNIVKPHRADINDIWQRSMLLGNYFAEKVV